MTSLADYDQLVVAQESLPLMASGLAPLIGVRQSAVQYEALATSYQMQHH